MIEYAKIGVVILAAGSSSRLGYAKQLVEYKGKSLLQHTIDISDSLEFDIKILILGARKDLIESELDLKKYEVVINENWKVGMSSSIKCGVLRSQELIKVQLDKNCQATFSEYVGNIGVPAIFSAEVFYDLKELKGDEGAKKLIYDQNLDFEIMKFQKGNFDVDTAEDVELLKKMEEK